MQFCTCMRGTIILIFSIILLDQDMCFPQNSIIVHLL